MKVEGETNEVNDTISTGESAEETVIETTEDTLYGAENQTDESIDETKEETSDSESESDVAKSQEETESGDDDEATDDQEEKVDYKLELSEQSVMDNSMLEGIESFAKENNLSKDMATSLLGKQEELLAHWVSAKSEEIEAERDGWRDQVVNDKVMGGENLDLTIENSRRAVEKFASPEFITMLRDTGYGDHPEVVKFFSTIGSVMSDDKLISGKEFGGEKTTEDYFYGTN